MATLLPYAVSAIGALVVIALLSASGMVRYVGNSRVTIIGKLRSCSIAGGGTAEA